MGEQDAPVKKRPLAVHADILLDSKWVGDAIWVALWAYDRATKQCLCEDGSLVGLVLGGTVVRDAKIASELGRSVWWVRRWRAHAARVGLLRTRRFPYGNQLAVVLPGKKFLRHEVKPAPEWAETPTRPKMKQRARTQDRVSDFAKSEEQEAEFQSEQNRFPET